jgi:hypothetical protein
MPKTPPTKQGKSTGLILSLALTAIFTVFTVGASIYWFRFPEQREASGALFTYVAVIISAFQSFLKVLIELGWLKEIKISRSINLDTESLKKAGKSSLIISAIAVLVGGGYFWSSLESTSLRGKTVASGNFLSNYGSMYMGDQGDIEFSKLPGEMEFTYKTNGKDPHQWEYKYINGEKNPNPAKFAGIMLADGDWGNKAGDGYDLRWHKEIRWKACIQEGSDLNNDGDLVVEFVAGGISWRINDALKKNEPVPFPDSLPKQSLGIYTLKKCPDGEVMSFSLSNMHQEDLQKVIGGFGWIVSWAPNDVVANSSGTGPEQAKTFTISISEVQYVKDNSLTALLSRNLETLFSIALVIFIVFVMATMKAVAPQTK